MSAGRNPLLACGRLRAATNIADVPGWLAGGCRPARSDTWRAAARESGRCAVNREVFGEVEVELVPRVCGTWAASTRTSTVLGQPAVVPALPVGRPLRRQWNCCSRPGAAGSGTAADRRHDRPVAPAPGAGAGDQPARNDVAAALALGAKALLIGRAHLYGSRPRARRVSAMPSKRCAGRPRHRARGRGPGRGALPSCPARTQWPSRAGADWSSRNAW